MTRALVLGGSGALGGEVCRQLAAEGVRVAFTFHRGEERARALAAEIGALALRMDARAVPDVEAAVDAAAEALGGLDALVQCAGVAVTMECAGEQSHHRMPHVDVAGFDLMMDVNVRSTYFAIRRAAPLMTDGGNVVLIGSIDGVKPVPSPVHYAASKGALMGMTGALAKELGPAGIRVNLVAPGILEAGISRDIPPNLLDEYVKHCGLKRVGRLAEVAAFVAWMAAHNTYVTGQTVLVDGAL